MSPTIRLNRLRLLRIASWILPKRGGFLRAYTPPLRDDREDYGEERFLTAAQIAGRLVVVVWTPRDGTRRIISMRYAHEREAKRWRDYLARSG